MTQREAILMSLADLKETSTSAQVVENIIKKKYYSFEGVKKPSSSISKELGEFIRNGDSRVKRIKSNSIYLYYLSKDEKEIGINTISPIKPNLPKKKTYSERSLHKLLNTFLKSTNVYSKTIFHEKSKNSLDSHQKWIHPDMVGVSFLNLNSNASKSFLKAVNNADIIKLVSYEIKKEINNDYELKKSFFQAVSNSSWANYGYLVAFEISNSLNDEMERLSQSFGIGIIELNPNPYESKILYPSKLKELDYVTMDKLCKINKNFADLIEQSEKLLTADERYAKSTEKELDEFCDKYFHNESEIEKYCNDKNIPFDKNKEE